MCFDILVERFKDDVLAEAALESADALTMALIEEFQRKETTIGGKDEPLGKMHRNLVKQALVDLSAEFLGLSKLQITAIMSEATTIENDEVDYEIFAIATEETPSGSRTPDHPLGICDSCTDHWIQAGTLLRDVDAGRDYHVRNVVICPRDSDTE